MKDQQQNDFNKYFLKKVVTEIETKVPIRKGCKNRQCFCTGDCQTITGWRDKTPEELRDDRINQIIDNGKFTNTTA